MKSLEIIYPKTKKCKSCGIYKTLDCFYVNSNGKHNRQAKCIECECLYVKSLKYNITENELREMYESQEHRCKICKIHKINLKKGLHVDHCHKTGKVRGLLCHSCNMLLGFARDRTDLLKRAIKYLDS